MKKTLIEMLILTVTLLVISCPTEITHTNDLTPPEFSLSGGTYYGPVSITLHSSSSTIRYTTDGTTPHNKSPLYDGPISLYSHTIVKAISIGAKGSTSDSATETYAIYFDNDPYVNIAEGAIFHVSSAFSYSVDNGATYEPCIGTAVSIDGTVGDHILVRLNEHGSLIYDLGVVERTHGSDLMPGRVAIGSGWFSDRQTIETEEKASIFIEIHNFGNKAYEGGVSVSFYISTDQKITQEDIPLVSFSRNISIAKGESQNIGVEDFIVPSTIEPNAYYVGAIITPHDVSAEMNRKNYVSLRQFLDTVQVLSPQQQVELTGALKVVNSWGVGGWEQVPDGHYWITYDSAISLKMPIYYYDNTFSHIYKPTILAVFSLEFPHRDECLISFGLGDPSNPIIEKEFQSRWGTTLYCGDDPFEDEYMALDISEFAPFINSYNLYMKTDTTTSIHSGQLHAFSVELYQDYEDPPYKILHATAPLPIASNTVSTYSITTAGALSAQEENWIKPLPRTVFSDAIFMQEKPTKEEIIVAKQVIGEYDPTIHTPIVLGGKYGMGLLPPSAEEWEHMEVLREFSSSIVYGGLPNVVDHSASKYFPPIANQGREGSCAGFTYAYYIQTYTEAKERNWDLSSVVWIDSTDEATRPGYPSDTHRVISPEFIYNQINRGTSGSSPFAAASFIIRIGGAPWSVMPYTDTGEPGSGVYNHPWPSEEAFREAPNYRGREVGQSYWSYNTNGYFILDSPAKLELLQMILASGYCVGTSVRGEMLYPHGGEYLLNSVDVISGYQGGPMNTNHANTIVGYKEGLAWDPHNPEQ